MDKISEGYIDNVLSYLTLAEESGAMRSSGSAEHKLPLVHFDGAWLGDSSGKRPLSCCSYELSMIDPGADAHELGKVNLGNWSFSSIDPSPDGGCAYEAILYRKIPLKEARGYYKKLISGDLVESSIAFIRHDGTYDTARSILERRSQGFTFIFGGVKGDTRRFIPEVHEAVLGAKSLALTYSYTWSVRFSFGWDGAMPAISIPTDPTGAREAFKLRDVPPGKSRRAALRHWVTTYYRRAQPDLDIDPTLVCAHLRGAQEFTSNGLKCKIIPSQYDLKRAEEYRAKRKAS